MSANVELMNLYWTSSGVFPGDGEISPHSFRDRVESAARAGFKGIGIWHADLEHTMLHHSLKEMKMILDDNNMKHIELEFLTDWFLDGARKAEADSRKKRLFEASEVLHAKHIKIGDFYNSPCSLQSVTESFASLCNEAKKYGAVIGFEIMPCAVIHTIEDALSMLEGAGAENGGIILDIVQVANLGITYPEIKRIPLKYLINVELNDGALQGNPLYDPSRERRFCGEGDFDIKGFIECIQSMGYIGPWAVEVMSKELCALPLDEINDRAFKTTISEFENH